MFENGKRFHDNIFELFKSLTQPDTSMDDICEIVLKYAKDITSSPTGFVTYSDPETSEMQLFITPKAHESKDKSREFSGKEFSHMIWSKSGAEAVEEFVNGKRGYFINEVKPDMVSQHLPNNHVMFSRFMIVPVYLQGDLVGKIVVVNSPRDYTEQDLSDVEKLADYFAIVIQRHRYEEAINHTSKITFNVMNNLNAIITVTDVETYKVLFANKFAKEKFGDIEGKICWSIAKKNATGPCDNCEIAQLQSMEEGAVFYQEVQNEVNGCWYHTTNSLIEWIDGRTAHMQIAVDISERINMETQLRQTADKLMELNSTKDKFFSIIAHDLKNPFYSMMGFSEILVNKARQMSIAEVEECAEIIHDSARNAHQLLQNLLVWSQSQTGKIRFQPQLVDLELLADNCLEFVKTMADQKQVQLIKEYAPTPHISADINMLTTVVRNLLTNAVKFTDNHGTITLSLNHYAENAIIIVEDTGIGMSNEDIQKLFRIDVDNKTIGHASREGKGTGLGLILCKEFVQKHDGSISITSEPGIGTTFCVMLPIHSKPLKD
jgi:signal transduction histidine kinase